MKRQHFYKITLMLLLLALLTACQAAPLAQPETAAPASEAEPARLEVVVTESEFYAANPELMTANRFPAAVPEAPLTESEFYAANPELMTVNRFAAAVPQAPLSEAEFYAANPELMTAGRYFTELAASDLNAFPRTARELEFSARYHGPTVQE